MSTRRWISFLIAALLLMGIAGVAVAAGNEQAPAGSTGLFQQGDAGEAEDADEPGDDDGPGDTEDADGSEDEAEDAGEPDDD
jgi:hypothetical protein